MDRLKVGIIFGGRPQTHSLSVRSAYAIARSLDLDRYEPLYIGITTRGAWKLCTAPDTDWENRSCQPVVLSPDPEVHGLLVLDQEQQTKTIRLDVVFPVLHGQREAAAWIA